MAENYADILNRGTRVSDILGNLLKIKNNPAAIQRQSIGVLRDVLDGKVELVDPTNPLVFLLETSAINTAAGIIDNETSTRKLYPRLAQTEEDVYRHMSDKDYIDIFASAASTNFIFAANKDELVDAMVYDGVTGIRKLVIPRNSEFTIADTTFSMQYPVEIQQLQHGGIETVYDVDKISPLQSLTTNVVPKQIRKLVKTQAEWLFLDLAVQQFKTVSYKTNISATSGLSKTYRFVDKFYHARVYQKNNATGDQWVELLTTHTEQVHDPIKPTAVLKVIGNQLTVTIPQIYLTTNLVRGTLRVDIYQTKGALNMVMSNYVPSAFGYEWKAIDSADMNQFTAPLMSVKNLLVYSTNTVSGGKDNIPFEALRDRVIRNAVGMREVPITNVQIETALENDGYEVVKNTDVVTNRIFLATKSLPTPFDERLITAAASSIETLVINTGDAVLHPKVRDNGRRITLVPEIVYQNQNGVIRIVPDSEVDYILAQNPEMQANIITAGGYLYTPFHYVLDSTSDEFEVRPYYLNGPEIKYVTFVTQNDKTLLQVSTTREEIRKLANGYLIRIVAEGDTNYNDLADSNVHVQLSFTPEGEQSRAYLLGQLVGKTDTGNRIFEFFIKTNFDVDSNNHLYLENFLMFDNEPRKVRSRLDTQFDILYSTSAVMPISWTPGIIDTLLGKFQLPLTTVGITANSITTIFGNALNTLWSRSRTQVSGPEYKQYTSDVPKLYETDVYRKDPATGLDFSIVNGEVVFTILHKAGDPVLDDNGKPVLLHKAGDIINFPLGQPIPVSGSKVVRELDMMFVEGVYYFATDTASSTYRSQIVSTVVSWLTNDLKRLSANLLEKTKIYFYPKTNMGSIKVMVENGQVINIEAGQSLTLKLYVNKEVFENSELRDNLSNTAIRVIDSGLRNILVSVADIVTSLQTAFGGDVLAMQLSGLGGQLNLPAFTIIDSSERASLRKRLSALPNNKLIAVEDVVIDFVRHTLDD